MSESNDIFTQKNQIDSLNVLSKGQEDMLTAAIQSLEDLKASKRITEESWRRLTNVWRELDSLRELYYVRLLNSLKRGDMVLR